MLLLDQDGAIDLSFGLFGAVLALFFAITGIALLWRRPSEPEVAAPTVSETLTAPQPEPRPPAPERDRLRDIYRGGFGVALIGGAALIVLSLTGALDSLGDAVADDRDRDPRPRRSSWRRSGGASAATSPPSAPSGSARRSAPRWPRTSTTRSSRR